MATTTPNFGWAVPTSTDLVKDGAVAIETLGDSIDASLVDLKGGTTGQVLAKASNTDMDFSWVAQDDSNAIQNSIVDAKGDIIAATANDTPARLAVGTNGQVLTADSTAATGLAWTTPAAGGGKVLQVVSATSTTQTQVTGTTYGDANLSLSITPTSATSKILVMVNQTLRANNASAVGTGAAVRVLRGSTSIYNPNPGAYEIHYWESLGSTVSREAYDIKSLVYLDSPATTSATTYKTQIRGTSASDTASAQMANAVSVITLLEIGA
jgi:hypothetical protein